MLSFTRATDNSATMGIFSFIFGKRANAVPPVISCESDRADHLGNAATAGTEAKAAVQNRRFDDAWRLFHVQKQHYQRHALRYGMTPRQALALDGSVHEHLANIRRLENKHDDALIHMLYCVTSNTRPTKAQSQKLQAYFSRCQFIGPDAATLASFVDASRESPDFARIQVRVAAWRRSA